LGRASGVNGDLRKVLVPLRVQFGSELSVLFGEPISFAPFFVGFLSEPVRLSGMA
jgi:hypothetical protein